MNNTFKTRIPDSAKLMQIRFIPKGNCYVMEVCYQIEVPDCFADSNRVAAIDLGVENFITMTNNIGEKPIVIKGGVIKSINQYYNKMRQYIVDAFTNIPFTGNPAAVCVMESWPSEESMMKLAMENNLSETAFIVKEEKRYHLRWFTPGTEVIWSYQNLLWNWAHLLTALARCFPPSLSLRV